MPVIEELTLDFHRDYLSLDLHLAESTDAFHTTLRESETIVSMVEYVTIVCMVYSVTIVSTKVNLG